MKRTVHVLVIVCFLVGIVGIVGCTGLPTISPPGEKETPGAAEPEGKFLQLYPGELANQLFNEDLTELQRENIWNKYKGEHVKWVGQLVDVKTWKDSLVATFLNWRSVSVLICGEKEAEKLSRLSKNDLVIYRGTLDGYGKDADLFPPDGVLESPLPDERVFPDKQVFRLRDGIVDGLLLTPLWSNQEIIDVPIYDCEMILDNNLLYVTKLMKKECITYILDAESGKILEQSERFPCGLPFLGIDSDHIYYASPGAEQEPPSVIIVDKATRQISSVRKVFKKYDFYSRVLWVDDAVAYVYAEQDRLMAVDITTQETLWSFQFLPDEELGQIRVGADTVFIERRSGKLLGAWVTSLLALDKNTGEERYTIQPPDKWPPYCHLFGLDLSSRKVFISKYSEGLQCLDEITGELLWQSKEAPFQKPEGFLTGGSSLIMRMEYYHDTEYGIDKNTGRVKWTKCYYDEPGGILAAKDGIVISFKNFTILQASRLQEVP